MKKTYLLLLTLFVSIVALAEPVTPDEARQKITKVMSPRRSSAVLQDLRLVATSHYQEQEYVTAPSFYVFNVGEGQGYVIAGADDRIPAVLGYSDRGSFDPDNMPVNMQAWLEGYNHQMEYLSHHPEAAAPQRTVSGSSIDPLLICQWGQGNPYNSLCPMDGDSRSVTGCSATAMAQVMYFWKYPNYTIAEIPAYVTADKKLSVAAVPTGTFIDWANMLPRYTGNETADQINAVANLMLMCGTALQMNYRSTNSSAYTSRAADLWKNYFGYDAGTTHERRDGYRTAAWNQKVYDELKAGRPVLYYGTSTGGGHAFVIDGYGDDDYFHVNWGWNGGSNGYFLLSILDSDNNTGIGASSSADGYSYEQGAIFGAQPNTGILPTKTYFMSTSSITAPQGTEFTRTDISEDFSFKVGASFWNTTGETCTLEMGFGVFDNNNQLLQAFNVESATLDNNYGYNSKTLQISYGANIDNGIYFIKPISRLEGTDTWYANDGSESYNLTAFISNNTLTLMEPTFGLTGTMEFDGKKEVGTATTVTATITNNGTLYNGQIFLLVNGLEKANLVSGRYFDIDAGQTENVEFSFIPKTSGENSVSLCTRAFNSSKEGYYEYTPFMTGTVIVQEAVAATLKMTPKTKNAVKENGQDVVKEDKAIVSIDVTNIGSTDYDNDAIVKLYKFYSDNRGSANGIFRQRFQLAAGASTNVEVELDNIEDGARYFYYVYYMSSGEEVRGYQYSKSFYVHKSGEEPEVEKFTVQSIDVQGTMKAGDEVEMTFNIKNEGNVQTGKLYVFINDVKTGDIAVDIAPGETKAYKVKFLPTTAGEYTVKVTTDEAGQVLAGEAAAATKTFTVEPKEETAYYLVSDLNGWSTSDKSYAFTKLTDGKTWEITFQGNDADICLKVAPGSAYDDQTTFWDNLLCAETDRCTVLQGTMVKNGGAWLLAASLNAESYTMRIVPSEMSYEITYQEKEKPFEPEPPYYYIGTGTGWTFDATKVFADNGDGTYSITIPAVYDEDGNNWFKVAPANAIAEDGTITWAHLYSTDEAGSTLLSGTMTIGDGQAWVRPQTDGAESYTITITPATKAISIQINIPQIEKFTVQAIHVEGTMKPGEELNMTINVKNEGNVQTGKLYLFVNNEKTSEIDLDITPGETKIYEVKYTPTTEGDLIVKVTSDEAGENLAGDGAVASQTITITGIELLVREMGGGPVSVYALNGNKMAESQGEELSAVLKSLPKGVYIIRVGKNSKTIYN